jgi:FkbM family methyltransferase
MKVSRSRKRIVTREGLTFDLDLGEMIDLGLYLQEYERDIAAAIEHLCQPGWTALDVGANVGAHTLRLARCVGPQGRVCAFEPMDFAFRKLVRNVSLNPLLRVETYQVALSDREEHGVLLAARSSWRSDGARRETVSKVDRQRLDDWRGAARIRRVDMIKVDVDGAEFAVLKGGSETVGQDHPVILLEVGAWHFREVAANPLALLRDFGYRFWDTRTGELYADLEAIRSRLPERDDAMSVSLNVLCSVRGAR